ncbi:MAG: GIY-YIG nuclease family protein [Terriglobales bacterium]
MGFSVYGIQNITRKRIYIGHCEKLEERLRRHNTGGVKSTKSDGPWALVALQVVGTRGEARWIEYQLKRSRGRRKRWLQEYAVRRQVA